MKTLNITFTSEEYDRIVTCKESNGNKNWHDFILLLCEQMEATE